MLVCGFLLREPKIDPYVVYSDFIILRHIICAWLSDWIVIERWYVLA